MEKNKLIKILEGIRVASLSQFEKKLLFSGELVNFENILNLKEEEVEDVLNTKKIELKISKLYLYMNKDNIPTDIKKKFEETVEQGEYLYIYLNVLERFHYLEREDGFDYVRAIMCSKGETQKKIANELISYNEILKLDNSLEIIKTVAMQENEDDARHIQKQILSTIGSVQQRYYRDWQEKIVITEKSVKELLKPDSLNDLIVGLKESNETEISINTKVRVKIKK